MNGKQEIENGSIMGIATRNVISAPPTMRIIGAIELLTHWGFRRLPIVDPGTHRLKGIMTARDVVNFLGGGEKFNLINIKHEGNFLAAINESVSRIMKDSVRTLPRQATIPDAISIIINDRIGGIPIIGPDQVLEGIVTERDVLKVLCKTHSSRKVSDIMTRSLLVQNPDCPLRTITRVMTENQFRRIPIVKNDVLFGIITATDIVRYIGSGQVFERLITGHVGEVMDCSVRDLISGNLFTTEPQAGIHDIARVMLEKKVGALPVIDQGRLVGLITEFDLVRALSVEADSRR